MLKGTGVNTMHDLQNFYIEIIGSFLKDGLERSPFGVQYIRL
jgi:hypothetical protein